MTEKQREIIEEFGWQIHECNFAGGKKGYELEKHSPAGEDFIVSVEAETEEEFAENVRIYAAEFDPEEHIEMWAAAKYDGKDSTIPSIKELVEDADAIDKMLQELAAALSGGSEKPEPEDKEEQDREQIREKLESELMEIIEECQKELGEDYRETASDYEITAIEAYMMMCYGYKKKIGGLTARSVVVFGRIFDIVHELLDKGLIKDLREDQ